MALMNDIDPRPSTVQLPSFNIVFKDVFGCAIFCVILVGAVFSFLRKDFGFEGQVVALIVGALLGAIGAVLLQRPTSRH